MTDTLKSEARSRLMGRIGCKDTVPEKAVRSLLHQAGFRFRLYRKDLPGSPDIVLPKYKTVIFVHGCFWHRHPGCSKATTPKDNAAFWQDKFEMNGKRDKRKEQELEALGWRVIVVWQCQTTKKNLEALEQRLKVLLVPHSE